MTEKKAEKTSGNVQAAEAEKPKNAEPEQPVQPTLQIPAKARALAKSVGVPLEPIVEWAQTTEARITQIENGLQDLGVKLEPVVQLAARVQAAQAQQPVTAGNPMAGGYGISVGDVLKAVGMSGGGGIQEEYFKKMMDLQFERLTQDVSFSRTMENYVKSQFAAKMGKKLTEDIAT